MADEFATLADIAAEWGVPLTTLRGAYGHLRGFPQRLHCGNQRLYRRSEIIAYAAGRNMRRVVNDARNAWQRALAQQKEQPSPFNQQARRFISGAFLPRPQREQLAFKKMVARTTQPKTHTVHLVHDWMLEKGRDAG